MKYLVVIEKAEGNYSSYSPDLPGCTSAGDTIEETREYMTEAINFYLEDFIKEGQEFPKPRGQASIEEAERESEDVEHYLCYIDIELENLEKVA